MRIGILGGTFNPPHRGHLALAQTVMERDLADCVLLIPAAQPPHKAAPEGADSLQRLAMTRLLAEEDARLSVEDIEIRRKGPSYTIDTVLQIASWRPEDSLRLIIGSDMAKSFATWRDYRVLLQLAPPLVAERPDSLFSDAGPEQLAGMSAPERAILWQGRFVMQPVDVSSTLVRNKFAEGAADAEMLSYLTAPVLRYIRNNTLYSGRL